MLIKNAKSRRSCLRGAHHQRGSSSALQRTSGKGYLRAGVTISYESALKCCIVVVCLHSTKPIKAHDDQSNEGAGEMPNDSTRLRPLLLQTITLWHLPTFDGGTPSVREMLFSAMGRDQLPPAAQLLWHLRCMCCVTVASSGMCGSSPCD